MFQHHLFQSVHKLAEKQLAEYKEVFMLFDKDQDGVLSFTELGTAMKTLGQRPSGNSYLLFIELCLCRIIFVKLSIPPPYFGIRFFVLMQRQTC